MTPSSFTVVEKEPVFTLLKNGLVRAYREVEVTYTSALPPEQWKVYLKHHSHDTLMPVPDGFDRNGRGCRIPPDGTSSLTLTVVDDERETPYRQTPTPDQVSMNDWAFRDMLEKMRDKDQQKCDTRRTGRLS